MTDQPFKMSLFIYLFIFFQQSPICLSPPTRTHKNTLARNHGGSHWIIIFFFLNLIPSVMQECDLCGALLWSCACTPCDLGGCAPQSAASPLMTPEEDASLPPYYSVFTKISRKAQPCICNAFSFLSQWSAAKRRSGWRAQRATFLPPHCSRGSRCLLTSAWLVLLILLNKPENKQKTNFCVFWLVTLKLLFGKKEKVQIHDNLNTHP